MTGQQQEELPEMKVFSLTSWNMGYTDFCICRNLPNSAFYPNAKISTKSKMFKMYKREKGNRTGFFLLARHLGLLKQAVHP